jgi:uncharacterized protein YndB with AHSA1/START domain
MAPKAARANARTRAAKTRATPAGGRKRATAAPTRKRTPVARTPRAAAAPRASERTAGANLGDEAVRAGSGRGWAEWFTLLDEAGARDWKHKDIAAYLYDELECPGWWNQMVAVGYEQARGLREVNMTAGGFQVSCSRSLGVPVADAYAAWTQAVQRRRWLGSIALTMQEQTPPRAMRFTWSDGRSTVEVAFTSKDAAHSHVTVQHRKLSSARAVASMRGFWSEALERLRLQLEA